MTREFTLNTKLAFTPRARQVWSQNLHTGEPHRRLWYSSALGDLVQLHGCSAEFVVIARCWIEEPDAETLEIVLDLPPSDEPVLKRVS